MAESIAQVPAIVSASPIAGVLSAESGLPKTHHEAYRQKLAGKAVQEIADSYGVDRTTIWRWCKAVEQEALQQLADEPVFNLIVREVNRLTDIEEQARIGAESTKSDRAKAMYLAEARRAAVSRQNLLITTGIFPKAPEQIYRVTATMKPAEQQGNDRAEPLSREKAIEDLIQARRYSRAL